jgi:hypothetical protein
MKLFSVAFVFMTFVFLLVMRNRLFTIDSACCVVRGSTWLHFLWYGYFSVGALMVVCRTMELDGDKNVQLVQMQMDKAKWIFFLYIKMKGVFLEESWCGLHSIGKIVFCYIMFLLKKDAW